MKAKNVRVGGEYICKVSDSLTVVKIIHAWANGKSWEAINTATGHKIFIRSPQRLRGPANESIKFPYHI